MMRIALLVTVLMAIGTQAQTAKVDGWRKLSIPEGLGGKCCDLQSAYAANDGYIYISGDAGTFRARVETPEQWTNISDGLHKYERGIKPALVFGETPRGEILAGVGHGRPCSSCEIVKWDPTDTKWYSMKADFKPGTVRWSGFAYDSKGNIWASSYMGGSIYRSKNDGKNFEEVIPGGYRIVGQPGGAISAFIIINDELYWGGEGGLMRTSLDLKHSDLLAAPGPDYHRNLYGIVSDGAYNKPPATEIVIAGRVDRNGCGIQRYDVPMKTWSDSCTGAPQWWQFIALVAGNHPHEYYASGSSSGSGGVYRTLDGGKTWSDFSQGLDQSLCHNNICVTRITISPVDGSKYLLVGGYQLWYHR